MALCMWGKYNTIVKNKVCRRCEGTKTTCLIDCLPCGTGAAHQKYPLTNRNCQACGTPFRISGIGGCVYCQGTGLSTEVESYTQGTYLTTITAEANTYPQNGRHTDGYWYVYQGLANKAPTISGTDTDLGTLTELEYKYSINDTDPSDTITVVERLNGVQLRSFTATRDIEYTIKPIWQEVLNGTHTLTITATDNIGASTVRTITFAKAEHELEFTLQTPLPADDLVTKTIMSITREIPAGAVMQIYVCNNGFDEIPTWEDITAKVVDGEKFFFANTVKTAAEWGYNIKICVQRLGADVGDTIFITSVGGNYE